VVQWSELLATDSEVRFWFPALPDFASSTGMGSTISGSYWVGIVCSRNQATERISFVLQEDYEAACPATI
jgi:hypothetical protein